MKTIWVFFISMILFGCDEYLQPKEQKKRVARVGSNYLYESDLANLGTSSLSVEDSARIVDSYIDNWIKKQTLLQNASRNLSEEQLLEVEQQVLEYKESLLSYMYESRMLEQRLDSTITKQQIADYYRNHQQNFVIQEPIVKFIAIKRDKEFQNLSEINSWILEYEKEGNDADLKEYCSFESISCSLDMNEWASLNQFYETLGAGAGTTNVVLRKNRLFQREGEDYFYLYKLFEIQREGVYPQEYVVDQIRTLILREREQNYLEELRDGIFQSAKSNNEIEVYNE